MSNPNASKFTTETDDSADSSSISSEKPVFNGHALDVLLGRDRPVEEKARDHKASEEKSADTDKEKDDDSVESDSPAPKRTKVGQAIRGLLKRSRSRLAASANSIEFSAPRPAERPDAEPAANGTLKTEDVPETEVAAVESMQESEPDFFKPARSEQAEPASETPEVSDNNIFDELQKTAESPVDNDPPPPPSTPPPLAPPDSGGNFGNLPPVPPVANTDPLYVPPPAAANTTTERNTTIIDKRSSLTGHLMTLWAANFLSKRRDRKIRREVRKIDQEQKRTKTEVAADIRRTSAQDTILRSENREQHDRLRRVERRLERVPEDKKPEASPAKSEAIPLQYETAADVSVGPVRLGEVLAASPVANKQYETGPEQHDKGAEKEKAHKEQLKDKKAEDSAFSSSFEAKAEEERRDNKPAAEKDTDSAEHREVKEAMFDRRHEIKDEAKTNQALVPVQNSLLQRTAGSRTDGDTDTNTLIQERLAKAKEMAQQAGSMIREDESYRQAVRSGFLIGVSTVAIGLIAYVLF